MNTKHSLPTIIATAAAISLPASISQAVSYELNAQATTVALTLKFEVEGTFYFDTDENGKLVKVPSYDSLSEKYDKNDNLVSSVSVQAAKVVSAKYGNAEIIKELAEADQLPDGKASGWALVAIPDGGGIDGQYEIVARKKIDGEIVDVPVAVSVSITRGATAYTITDTIANKYDKDGNQTTTAGGGGTASYDGVVSVEVSGNVSASATVPLPKAWLNSVGIPIRPTNPLKSRWS